MQTLTFEGVRDAARDYYQRGKLTAQHPDRDMRVCMFSVGDGTYRCAVGAGLDDETIQRAFGSVYSLDKNFVVRFATSDDFHKLCELQMAHDDWCAAERDNDSDKGVRRENFCGMIGVAA